VTRSERHRSIAHRVRRLFRIRPRRPAAAATTAKRSNTPPRDPDIGSQFRRAPFQRGPRGGPKVERTHGVRPGGNPRLGCLRRFTTEAEESPVPATAPDRSTTQTPARGRCLLSQANRRPRGTAIWGDRAPPHSCRDVAVRCQHGRRSNTLSRQGTTGAAWMVGNRLSRRRTRIARPASLREGTVMPAGGLRAGVAETDPRGGSAKGGDLLAAWSKAMTARRIVQPEKSRDASGEQVERVRNARELAHCGPLRYAGRRLTRPTASGDALCSESCARA